MHGPIAAGTPIEAIQTKTQVISMPPDMLAAGDTLRSKCAATA
jgi:repressor LexA